MATESVKLDLVGQMEAYVLPIEQREKLTAQLTMFASGRWKMLSGGNRQRDVTEDRVLGLKRRVKELEGSIAAFREQAG